MLADKRIGIKIELFHRPKILELVDTQKCGEVLLSVCAEVRKGRKILSQERQVRQRPPRALVDVIKHLEVWRVHKNEKGLFEGAPDGVVLF